MFYINAVGLYNYQDHQPFYIFHYPIFVAIVNGVPPMLAGIILYKLVPVVRGWSYALLFFAIPFAFAGNAFGNGWLYLAYRQSGPHPSMVWLTLLAALATALSVAVIYAAALMAGVVQRTQAGVVPAQSVATG
jgi:hypothetical protein